MTPGSLEGLQLVVNDVRAARDRLLERGVEVGEVQLMGASDPRPAGEGEDLDTWCRSSRFRPAVSGE
jgi:hypothetical protein